jgi:hypothetical protein
VASLLCFQQINFDGLTRRHCITPPVFSPSVSIDRISFEKSNANNFVPTGTTGIRSLSKLTIVGCGSATPEPTMCTLSTGKRRKQQAPSFLGKRSNVSGATLLSLRGETVSTFHPNRFTSDFKLRFRISRCRYLG